MSYVLVYMCKDLKYYVQQYRAETRLNGLKDNAFKYDHEWQARQDIPRCKIHLNIGQYGALHVEEVLPSR